MILKSHSNTLYLFSKYRICTFPHLTTCAHATWPLGVYRFICSLPVYHVFLLVFCSLPTLSHILNLSVTPCLSICQCYPLSSLPISPTTHPSLHHRIPATSVPNPVSQQLALNEGLWWWRWGRRRWRTWRRRVGLGLRGGVAPWEWRISALHEDRMFWTVLKARGTREEWTIHVHYVNTGEGAVRAGRWQSLCGEKIVDCAGLCDFWKVLNFQSAKLATWSHGMTY